MIDKQIVPDEMVTYFRANYVKDEADSLLKTFTGLRDMGYFPLATAFLLTLELGISFREAYNKIQESNVWIEGDILYLIAENGDI